MSNTNASSTSCIGCGTGLVNSYYVQNNSNTSGPYCSNCYGYYSSGSLYSPSTAGTYTLFDNNYILDTLGNLIKFKRLYCINGKCNKCGENKELIMSYSIIKLERQLCETCFLESVDKFFGIDMNVKLEEVLYR